MRHAAQVSSAAILCRATSTPSGTEVASPGSRITRWLAVLTRRGARRQIAAAAALTLLLVAVLTWLAFEPRGRYEEQISWTNVGAIPQLPGAPSILTPAAPPAPPPLIGEQAEA